MDKRIGLLAAVVCALLVVASPAAARTDWHGRDHGHGNRGVPTPNPGNQTCDPIDPSSGDHPCYMAGFHGAT
jgi:hypothetical protein